MLRINCRWVIVKLIDKTLQSFYSKLQLYLRRCLCSVGACKTAKIHGIDFPYMVIATRCIVDSSSLSQSAVIQRREINGCVNATNQEPTTPMTYSKLYHHFCKPVLATILTSVLIGLWTHCEQFSSIEQILQYIMQTMGLDIRGKNTLAFKSVTIAMEVDKRSSITAH